MKRRLKVMKSSLALSLTTLVLLMKGPSLCAEPKAQDAAVQQVLKKAQGVVRQLTEEKQALEQQQATLLQENETIKSDKLRLEAEVKRLDASLKSLAGLPGEVEQLKSSIQTLQGLKESYRNHKIQSKRISADNQLLQNAVQEREDLLSTCRKQNKEIVKVAHEAVEASKTRGLMDQVGEFEPFTGLGRIESENAAEDFHYRIDHLEFKGSTAPQSNLEPPSKDEPKKPANLPQEEDDEL